MATVVFIMPPPAPEELEAGFVVTVTRKRRDGGLKMIVSENNNITDATRARNVYVEKMLDKGFRYEHRAGMHFLVKREGVLLRKTTRLQVRIEVNARARLQ